MTDLALHDYQLVARDFLRQQNRSALFLDMGLGKTAASLAALEPRHLPVLVVAPKRVAEEVWHVEKDLWRPDLTLVVAKGEPAARQAALSSDANIVVLGRDNLRDVLALKRTTPFKTVIIDELSGYKSRASVRWKTMNKIVRATTTQHVWGLTGTPVPNGYMDLWSQVALLDGGQRLGKNITTYRGRYFMPGRQIANGVIVEWNLRPESEGHIKELIGDICLAMATEGRIKLPRVTVNRVATEMPFAVRRAYKTFSDTMVADLREIFGGEIHTAANAAILTSRLSQMTSGFVFVDDADLHDGDWTPLHLEKIHAIEEIVESAQGSGVLVAYRFIPEKLMLLQALGDKAHTIDEPDIIARWNRGEIPVLLVHPASAGHGLNLQYGGHTVVWTGPTWDLEWWDQLNKRVARQGQKHPVVIHVLLANKTVDQMIQARVEGKATVQGNLLAYLESPV